MCEVCTLVRLRCACVRCGLGNRLNPNHEGYYPHYGTDLIPDNVNLEFIVNDEPLTYTHVFVAEEDLCDSAELDDEGYWLRCNGGTPVVVKVEDSVIGVGPDDPVEGDWNSLCDLCRDNCYRVRSLDDYRDGTDRHDLLDLLFVSSSSDDGSGRIPEDVIRQAVDSANQTQGQERELSMEERIYRNVLQLLGYPAHAPIPGDPDTAPTAQPPL